MSLKDKNELSLNSKMEGVKNVIRFFVQLAIVALVGFVIFYNLEPSSKKEKDLNKESVEVVKDSLQNKIDEQ